MAELLNVLVHGGRVIHAAAAPSSDQYERGGRWWVGQTDCPARRRYRRDVLREATVADLDTKPRCRHCFPPDGAP